MPMVAGVAMGDAQGGRLLLLEVASVLSMEVQRRGVQMDTLGPHPEVSGGPKRHVERPGSGRHRRAYPGPSPDDHRLDALG